MPDALDYQSAPANVWQIVETRIAPHAASVGEEARFPIEAREAFQAMELAGLAFPSLLRGGDGDLMAQVIAIEEIARVARARRSSCSFPRPRSLLWCATLAVIATADRPGSRLGLFARQICASQTRAARIFRASRPRRISAANGWRIDGRERFISNAGWSEWYAVLARTDDAGFGVFYVQRDDTGISSRSRHWRSEAGYAYMM